ncbi:MAG TPA: helix-turn-helix domain-containing protein [Candidatus Eisenbacteria bacterium]
MSPREIGRASRRLVETLRLRGPLTAAELAEALEVGGAAVRPHLRALEAGGLVERVEERRPVGRPVARYQLTPRADEGFPKRYELLATSLLEAIADEWGPEGIERVLQRWEDALSARLDQALPSEPRARLDALAAHQNQHGFMASVRRDAEGVALVERNCPIAAAAARHPEICRHEAALFGRTLRWKTSLVACRATGDPACVFRVGRAPARSAAEPPPGTPERKE